MSKRYTTEMIKKIVEEQTKGEYSLLHIDERGIINPETGKANKRKMKIRHNSCGNIYKLDIYEFLSGKRRCGKCKGKALRKHFAESIASIKKKTLALSHGEYSFVDEQYINSKTKHKFKHRLCKTIFSKSWDKFKGTPSQAGQRCPNCQRIGMESMTSRYTRDILDHFDIAYVCEKRFQDCINPETGKVLPFDYYLPKINLIIEIDGEQHERASFTNWNVEGVINRDKIKNAYAEKKGITLVRIPAKEWSALPNFLFDILSEKLVKNLRLQDVLDVVQSSYPERISADLKNVHNGEYVLHDNFYTGSERSHQYKHLKCGHVFTTSLAYLKDNQHPCPLCRDANIKQGNYKRVNKRLMENSKGKYSLSRRDNAVDPSGKRIIHCHSCAHEWPCLISNLMQNKAGCPKCHQKKQDLQWERQCKRIASCHKKGLTLDKKQKHWLWHNKKRYSEGILKKSRLKLLKDTNLI